MISRRVGIAVRALAPRPDWPHPAMRSEQVNARWVKSSFSFANGNCVEVAELPGDTVGIRDSRDPGGPVLRFTSDEWHAFLGGVRNGEFDSFGR